MKMMMKSLRRILRKLKMKLKMMMKSLRRILRKLKLKMMMKSLRRT